MNYIDVKERVKDTVLILLLSGDLKNHMLKYRVLFLCLSVSDV